MYKPCARFQKTKVFRIFNSMCLQCYFEAYVIDDSDDKSLFERMKTITDMKLPCSCHTYYMSLLFPAVIMFASDSIKARTIKQHILHRLFLIGSDYPSNMFGLGNGTTGVFGRSEEIDIGNLRRCAAEFLYDHFVTCNAGPLDIVLRKFCTIILLHVMQDL